MAKQVYGSTRVLGIFQHDSAETNIPTQKKSHITIEPELQKIQNVTGLHIMLHRSQMLCCSDSYQSEAPTMGVETFIRRVQAT